MKTRLRVDWRIIIIKNLVISLKMGLMRLLGVESWLLMRILSWLLRRLLRVLEVWRSEEKRLKTNLRGKGKKLDEDDVETGVKSGGEPCEDAGNGGHAKW